MEGDLCLPILHLTCYGKGKTTVKLWLSDLTAAWKHDNIYCTTVCLVLLAAVVGSDLSAACGGRSEGSEWPRSVSDAGVRAKERTGHRNRNR